MKAKNASHPPDPASPLTPAVYQILIALAEGERHGYAIMKDVLETTDGAVRMGPGTLYGTLKRMLDSGLIAEAGERQDPDPGEERRRYYKLTALGARAASTETERMARIVRAATRRGLGGRPASNPSPA
jgi:DNA-binding PadR family transcriptional regulator